MARVFKPIVYDVIQTQLLFDDQVKTYRTCHYQNESFTVFKYHKYREYLESDQHQKTLSKTIISVDIIPNQTTVVSIIKNILIAVNNVNLC